MPKSTVLLLWNPAKTEDSDLRQAAKAYGRGKSFKNDWSVTSNLVGGESFFMIQNGPGRQLIGSGQITSGWYWGPHWSGEPGKEAKYVNIEWQTATFEGLPMPIIEQEIRNVSWRHRFSSGTKIDANAARSLGKLWNAHLKGVSSGPSDDLVDPPAEGGVIRVHTNRYERVPYYRNRCLAHYGFECYACGILMEDLYGQRAHELIHVHHLVPLSKVRKAHLPDPVKDMVPLCPNCHAVVHRGSDLMGVDALRKQLQPGKRKKRVAA